MRGRWNRAGFAVKRFREALPVLMDEGRTPRHRLLTTLALLQPVITNTSGLTPGERRFFYRLLADAGAFIDLEAADLGETLSEAPDSWIQEMIGGLTALLGQVLDEADSGGEYVADEGRRLPWPASP